MYSFLLRKSYSADHYMLKPAVPIMGEGKIFNVEKYAVHDGPGIRTTVFFKGCSLRCWWCHNPEGQNPMNELVYREARCVGCGECVEKCSSKALARSSGKVVLDRKSCNVCGACAVVCPSEALAIAGQVRSAEEIVETIERDVAFYEESEGGVTFSGGEPLLQPDFLKELLSLCSEREIHTTLDTSGYAPYQIINSISGKVDLFLYDIKSIDDAKHKRYTGVSNRLIIKNLEKLALKNSDIAVSLPIIPGVNDDVKDARRTGDFISSLRNVKYVSLLPYHKAGVAKYKSLGRCYKLEKLQPPSPVEIDALRQELEAFGLKVRTGVR